MRVGMSLQLQLVMIPLVENVRVIRRGRKLQSPWWRCSIVGYVIALVTYPIMSLLYPQYIYIYLLFIYLFIIIYIYTLSIYMSICIYCWLYIPIISLFCPQYIVFDKLLAWSSCWRLPSCLPWQLSLLNRWDAGTPKSTLYVDMFWYVFFCFVLTHKTISWTNRLGSLRLFMFFSLVAVVGK